MSQSTPSTSSIKTDIFEFCQSFAGILKPFAKSLDSVRSSIRTRGDAIALQRPLAAFSDAHHRLESLINKVAEQQAYVIIFGPLKSGKSTLMNAISAAYVSEVTSLPAYPCLVHVKHGESNQFLATRYSGEKLTFPDNASLQNLIKQSHETLAERLHEVEDRGEAFDPGVHYPDAIRRVDVEVPTRNLKDSLTVLVDTPGLYTRMKFGYGLMTREFRNSAACAVFVVKTDNLFLEQVFDEFNQLLDLFSRIFLVVNIDGGKRDIDADGSLRPSLESHSPGEVIRAFESLVMSAPLRRAQQEGRLKIYPIDLLNSAVGALKGAFDHHPEAADQGEQPAVPASSPEAPSPALPEIAADAKSTPLVIPLPPIEQKPADAPPANEPAAVSSESALAASTTNETSESPTAPEAVPAPELVLADLADASPDDTWRDHPEASFKVFLKDLTEYLNSSEYLQEFMGDALLMGTNLGLEVREHCSSKATETFDTHQRILETQLADVEARLGTIEQMGALDLKASFSAIQEDTRRHAEEVSTSAAAEALQKSLGALEAWFTSEASVADLSGQWTAAIQGCAERTSGECHQKLRSLVASPHGGIQLTDKLRDSAVGLNELIAPVVSAARSSLAVGQPALQTTPFSIGHEHLKVSKSLWDWLAFRTLSAIRRKIFGAPDDMKQAVSPAIKGKRLGTEGKQALEQLITGEVSRQFPTEAVRLSESVLSGYVETLTKELKAKLQVEQDKLTLRKTELNGKIADNRAIRASLGDLTTEASKVLVEVETLRERYHTYSRVEAKPIDVQSDEEIDEEIDEAQATGENDTNDGDSGEKSEDFILPPLSSITHPILSLKRIPNSTTEV